MENEPSIIVIGCSSGGLEALLEIVPQWPRDLPAAVFIVMHVPSQGKSQLPYILDRSGELHAAHAIDQEHVQAGRIYVAPPDFHLLLDKGHVRVLRGPRENNHRPAIDPLFRSAARVYGRRVIGVVLSGMLDDGAAGLFAVKSRGGIAIVQDPDDAPFPDMPRNALAAVPIDYCLSKREIPQVLNKLVREARGEQEEPGDTMTKRSTNGEIDREVSIESMDENNIRTDDKPGTPSVYGCPDCGGVLWELQDNERLRFRCRIGHGFSAEGLLRTQGETLESALWSAFRILQENAALSRRLAERARSNNHVTVAEKFARKSAAAEEQAELIRQLLLNAQIKVDPGPEQVPEAE
jgi:two-component system chemotaxis response regulator CheB